MQNDSGEVVDVYIPRKCTYTNRIIGARDFSSVQITVAEVDEKTGRTTGETKKYALSGFVRAMGESDDALNRLCTKDGMCSGLSETQQ